MKSCLRQLAFFAACLLAPASAAFAAPAAKAASVPLSHYDPILLNELAIQEIRAGDAGSAAILLERATLLAPYDQRIRHNLDTLRAWQAGKPAPKPQATSTPATAALTPTPAPALPAAEELPPVAPWPAKPAP